jgi:mono/diheme cytochrome c family protein
MNATRVVMLGLAALTIGIVTNGSPAQTVHAQKKAAAAPVDVYKDVYNGWKWWHVYCFRCHGTNAIATSVAPSLIDPNRRMSLPMFVSTARNGRPTLGMQSWRKLLDDKQLAQIYLYVQARTDKILPPGRPDEVGPNHGVWVPPAGWPKRIKN